MKRFIKKDSTDQTIDVFIQDSSSSVGAGLTGLAYNTASLVCYYRRGATGSATALTLATQTVGGAHSDGGFVEISSANMPGWYRLDLSDAIVATGVPWASIVLKGAANMAPCNVEIQMEAAPADVTHWLGTAAATPTVAGVPEVDITHVNGTAATGSGTPNVNAIQVAGQTVATNFADATAAYPALRGTVTGTPSTTVFRITVADDIAADTLIGMECSVMSSGGIPRGRQTISDSARVDATTQEITIDTALIAAPTVGDIAIVQ